MLNVPPLFKQILKALWKRKYLNGLADKKDVEAEWDTYPNDLEKLGLLELQVTVDKGVESCARVVINTTFILATS